MSDTATFRDFSRKRPRIFFTIDNQEFDGRKTLTPRRLQEAMAAFRSAQGGVETVTPENMIDKLKTAFNLLLKEESYNRFIALMDDEEADEPLDLPQLTEIFTWLIEQYSQRPTQASPTSSDSSSSDDAGTDSPAGAQVSESTP